MADSGGAKDIYEGLQAKGHLCALGSSTACMKWDLAGIALVLSVSPSSLRGQQLSSAWTELPVPGLSNEMSPLSWGALTSLNLPPMTFQCPAPG